MNINQLNREKWISDAAYYKSLKRLSKPGLEKNDWLEAENEFRQLMKRRVKSGLVRMNHVEYTRF